MTIQEQINAIWKHAKSMTIGECQKELKFLNGIEFKGKSFANARAKYLLKQRISSLVSRIEYIMDV